ncbi:hypothetical protein [Streptomyces asiaticus]|uniref:hypothetical protein n=1 Tax=Streptomyces asiaticus TaxID=114695 RepID=UPI003D74454D
MPNELNHFIVHCRNRRESAAFEQRVRGQLDVCDRCGARANARQIREIADWDMLVAAAIDRVDQWVAFSGFSSSVLTMTRSTSASVIFRGTIRDR